MPEIANFSLVASKIQVWKLINWVDLKNASKGSATYPNDEECVWSYFCFIKNYKAEVGPRKAFNKEYVVKYEITKKIAIRTNSKESFIAVRKIALELRYIWASGSRDVKYGDYLLDFILLNVYRARAGKLSIAKTPVRVLRYNILFVGYPAKGSTMTRDEESQIREIFRKHLEAATDEIAELDIDCGYYPPGYSGRFAEIMTQAVALMAETSHTTETESAA